KIGVLPVVRAPMKGWTQADRNVASEQVAIHVHEVSGGRVPDRPATQALAIVLRDQTSVGVHDIAQGIRPFDALGLNDFHQVRDVMGFEPVVVVEEGDGTAVDQVYDKAVDPMSKVSVGSGIEGKRDQVDVMTCMGRKRLSNALDGVRSIYDDHV